MQNKTIEPNRKNGYLWTAVEHLFLPVMLLNELLQEGSYYIVYQRIFRNIFVVVWRLDVWN